MCKAWTDQNKEKKPRDTIIALKSKDGNLLRTSKQMCNRAREFYEDLQTLDIDLTINNHSRERQINDTLTPLTANILDNEHFDTLSKPLTDTEISEAIKILPNGKAAGLDGITYELWKKLIKRNSYKDENGNVHTFDLIKVLCHVFVNIQENGPIPELNFHKGWLCPLYKKNDRSDISNYRPITILNADYRILTRILTNRLATVAPEIIHRDQAGFMSGRQISDQTELATLMPQYAETMEINGQIISLDQEKAYDRIRHDFLWASLRKFGFPDSFINTVKNLYKNAQTVVILNGEVSEPFTITRGVRQGDPLSCLLFNIAIESLAATLRTSSLEGFEIPGLQNKLIASLFADDTTIYLSENDDFHTLQDILAKWCEASGAKFNLSKTNILPIGTKNFRQKLIDNRRTKDTHRPIPNNIPITPDNVPVRILGCYIGNNVNQITIWEPTVQKIKENLDRWNKGHPTLEGKRLIINMEVGGRTQYLTRVQGMPADITKKIKNIIIKFLWNDTKVSPVNLDTMSMNTTKGGKKVLDIELRNEAIELMKMKQYLCLDKDRPPWAYLADRLIKKNATTNLKNIPENEVSSIPFLHSWKVATHGKHNTLPDSLKRMIKIALKHGIAFDGLEIGNDIKHILPIWFHLGIPNGEINWTDKGYKCLKQNHKITNTGEMHELANTNFPVDHFETGRCRCFACVNARAENCNNLNSCVRKAKYIMNKILPKWNPQNINTNSDLIDYIKNNPLNDINSKYFQPEFHIKSLKDGFRILTNQSKAYAIPATRENQQMITNHRNEVYTDGSCDKNGSAEARASSGIWFGPNDTRNRAILLPKKFNTNNAGELMAILYTTQTIPKNEILEILTDSKYTIDILTNKLPNIEDNGWHNTKNKEILQVLTYTLRKRHAPTILTKVKAHDGIPGNENADALAKAGLELDSTSIINLQIPATHILPGIKLSAATQSSIYKALIEKKGNKTRESTQNVLEMIADSTELIINERPTNEAIWKSYRDKTISKEIRNYLWRNTHNAYRLGKFWLNIPEYSQRAWCPDCQEIQNMDHILLNCTLLKSEYLWNLVKTIWLNAGFQWHEITYGLILGCNLIKFQTTEGKPDKSKKRLYTILITETAYLIWKTWCEWTISQESNPDKKPTIPKLQNQWIATIQKRISHEIILTNKRKYKNKSLNYTLVKHTWSPILGNVNLKKLTETEIRGVLVGRICTRPNG